MGLGRIEQKCDSDQTAVIAPQTSIMVVVEEIDARAQTEKVVAAVANSQGPDFLTFPSVRMSMCGKDRAYQVDDHIPMTEL